MRGIDSGNGDLIGSLIQTRSSQSSVSCRYLLRGGWNATYLPAESLAITAILRTLFTGEPYIPL
jgi:hypothetical protein